MKSETHTHLNNQSKIRIIPFFKGFETEITKENEHQFTVDIASESSYAPLFEIPNNASNHHDQPTRDSEAEIMHFFSSKTNFPGKISDS